MLRGAIGAQRGKYYEGEAFKIHEKRALKYVMKGLRLHYQISLSYVEYP